jgi:hypothetical protein
MAPIRSPYYWPSYPISVRHESVLRWSSGRRYTKCNGTSAPRATPDSMSVSIVVGNVGNYEGGAII